MEDCKVILLPYAGGDRYCYRNIFQNLLTKVTLEYPGRGSRMNEPLLTDINQLVNDVVTNMVSEIKSCERYIVFGHSMGALIGYLSCKLLQDTGFPNPIKFIASGRNAPSVNTKKKISHLPHDQFWNEISELGGVSNEIFKHVELMEYYTPILRADFELVESFKYDNGVVLNVPMDIYYGSEENILEDEIDLWKKETDAKVNITKLKGNHFFIFNHSDLIAKNSLFNKCIKK